MPAWVIVVALGLQAGVLGEGALGRETRHSLCFLAGPVRTVVFLLAGLVVLAGGVMRRDPVLFWGQVGALVVVGRGWLRAVRARESGL